jgi:hypothetical protein
MHAWIRTFIVFSCLLGLTTVLSGQTPPDSVEKFSQPDKFRQLEEILPTPNDYRTASGSPGRDYWQQNVDYKIKVELNDEDQTVVGSEKITYRNLSPDPLRYIWLQLDANIHAPDSDAKLTESGVPTGGISLGALKNAAEKKSFDGSLKIDGSVEEKTEAH